MKRSVCSCLVSLAFMATTSSAHAQVLLGHTRLAPVALEARCQVADGMLGSWTQLTKLGADPMHAAILLADQRDESGLAGSSCVPVDAPETSIAHSDHDALSSSATSASEVVGHVDMEQECVGLGCIAAFDESELETSVANPCPQESYCPEESYCCPFADLAASEPIDVNRYTDDSATEDSAIDNSENEVARIESLQSQPQSRANEGSSRPNLVGSSPMIFLIQEEYLPYDLDRKFPVEIGFFPIKGPSAGPLQFRATPLEEDVVYGPEPAPAIDAVPAPAMDAVASAQGAPSISEEARLAESIDLPIACYVDMALNYAFDITDADGPIRPWIDARRVGAALGPIPYEAVSSFVEWTQPAWPVLSAPVSGPMPQVVPQPAPQNLAPVVPALNPELEVAASTLHYAASGLERFAGALRGLGDSITRVASEGQNRLR